MKQNNRIRNRLAQLTGLFLVSASAPALASTIYWTDWTSGSTPVTSNYTAQGTMTTGTSSVSVTYTNAQGIGFAQYSGGTDYWTSGGNRNPVNSPYTSAAVDNIPTGNDIIALSRAGVQTLTFSQAIANPVFAYVSLNGNGYAFDQDFTILSFGDSSDGNNCGYWGCGTSYKNVVGNEYQLLGTGEPHGVIQFLGTFSSVSWRSLSNEYWNGFTVGVQGTSSEVYGEVPVPGSVLLLGAGLAALAGVRRKTIG